MNHIITVYSIINPLFIKNCYETTKLFEIYYFFTKMNLYFSPENFFGNFLNFFKTHFKISFITVLKILKLNETKLKVFHTFFCASGICNFF